MSEAKHGFFLGKRLVIFGAGYVGGALATEAIALGLRVSAVTRNPDKAEILRRSGVDVVVGDLAGAAWHGQVDAGSEFVVNCVSSGGGGVAGYRASYVDGLKSILAWAAQGGAKGDFVYTSSTSVYDQDGGVRVDESAPANPSSETGRILLEAEQLAQAWPGRRAFVLRLAGIYGPHRHHVLDQLRAGADVIPGVGTHRLNLAHRDDIVAAILAVLAADGGLRGGVFNVADDAPTAKAEVAAWLAARLGRSAPGFTGEATPGRRAVVPDRVIANGRLKEATGWRPRYPDFRSGYDAILR